MLFMPIFKLVLLVGCLLPIVSAVAQPPTQPAPLIATTDNGSRPIPDPTVLTTQAQEKSIAALRELLDAKIRAVEVEIETQKKIADRTDERMILRLDQIPANIETSISHLQRLMEEKFVGVGQQFQGRDVALAAALLAQKTSVDEQNKANAASAAKAEGATTKQIDTIQSIILANSKATDDKIDGVKTLLSSQSKSVDDKITDLRNTISDLRSANTALVSRGAGQNDIFLYIIAASGVLIGVLGFVLPKPGGKESHYYPRQPQYDNWQQQPPAPPPPQVVVPVSVPVKPA